MTIDLGGHTLTGGDHDGIRNGAAFNRTTIKNGTIVGFNNGIFIAGGEGHSIRGVKLRGGIHSIQLIAGARFSKIQKTVMSDTAADTLRVEGDDNLISQVVMVGGAGSGVLLAGNHNTITKSTIASMQIAGISVNAPATGNVFTRNTISATGGSCVFLSAAGGTGNQITKNLCEGNGSIAIRLVDADAGIVSGNTVIGGGDTGIVMGDSSSGNQVTKNTVTASQANGFLILAEAPGTIITGNVARRNRDNGIDCDSPDATIGKNTADANGDRGIDAVAGVLDAGGNKAHDNGKENCRAGVLTCK